jgi:hypothetical protein
MVKWNPKFYGGHIEINNKAGSKVTVYSNTDNDKSNPFCNSAENVVDAWWQGTEVCVKLENGVIRRYYSDCGYN